MGAVERCILTLSQPELFLSNVLLFLLLVLTCIRSCFAFVHLFVSLLCFVSCIYQPLSFNNSSQPSLLKHFLFSKHFLYKMEKKIPKKKLVTAVSRNIINHKVEQKIISF